MKFHESFEISGGGKEEGKGRQATGVDFADIFGDTRMVCGKKNRNMKEERKHIKKYKKKIVIK